MRMEPTCCRGRLAAHTGTGASVGWNGPASPTAGPAAGLATQGDDGAARGGPER